MAKKRYVYYSCTNYHRKHEKVYVREEELLKPVNDVLQNLTIPEDKITKLTENLRKAHQAENF